MFIHSREGLGRPFFHFRGKVAVGQNHVPKWHPGKWNHRLKPAVCPSSLISSHARSSTMISSFFFSRRLSSLRFSPAARCWVNCGRGPSARTSSRRPRACWGSWNAGGSSWQGGPETDRSIHRSIGDQKKDTRLPFPKEWLTQFR